MRLDFKEHHLIIRQRFQEIILGLENLNNKPVFFKYLLIKNNNLTVFIS
jgi:hypothetical protein